jgi:cytochrome c-type biogenesis protein CcmH
MATPQRINGWWLWSAALLLALAWLAGAAVARAQDATPPAPVTDDQVNAVAKQLYCPVCENIPLDVCPTQACVQWRATIREKLEAGWDAPAIKDYFAAQYGERVLAQPSTRGLNLLVWLLPPVSVSAGIFVLWTFMRRGAQPAARAPQAVPASRAAASDPYVARFEAELQERR